MLLCSPRHPPATPLCSHPHCLFEARTRLKSRRSSAKGVPTPTPMAFPAQSQPVEGAAGGPGGSYRRSGRSGSSCGPRSPRPGRRCTPRPRGPARRGSSGRRSPGAACETQAHPGCWPRGDRPDPEAGGVPSGKGQARPLTYLPTMTLTVLVTTPLRARARLTAAKRGHSWRAARAHPEGAARARGARGPGGRQLGSHPGRPACCPRRPPSRAAWPVGRGTTGTGRR